MKTPIPGTLTQCFQVDSMARPQTPQTPQTPNSKLPNSNWTCVQASETPDKKIVCTLDFQNVKVVSRNHLCSAYENRTE